ncbi:MAG: DUF6259 domain-containing protein [Armatimonadota bacterium]|nr:DUF6259 domain-containing protein [Armatimonadota bacterium]
MARAYTYLRNLSIVLVALLIPPMCHAGPITLENDRVLLDVDPTTGVFARVLDKASKLSLEPPQWMADNFRLVLLTPDKTTATILGKDQKLSDHSVDGNRLVLHWDGPLKDTGGGEHDLSIRMGITATGSSLEFRPHVVNNTRFKVQEVWYPLIGGLTDFAPDASAWVPISTPWEKPVKLPFESAAFQYPGHMIMSFACVSSKSLGKCIYFASHDDIARYKVYHLMEVGDKEDKDVFLSIHHSPFTPPGKTFEGSPVVLSFVEGDWRAAGQVYRKWFVDTFGIAPISQDWIRRQSFFLFTMFMLPEGTINYTFKDIPKWARAAKDCGINAVQISGWQVGGHDNGYPYYIPDPRLGTWKDLEDGIRACHKMGVKVFFFVNYQPMMVESNWYKNELHKYREMTADGGHTWMAGWGMGTLSARMGHPKLMTWADLSFPQFRKIIVDQFSKLAEIGGDGVHVDKMFPAGLCYNPDIPMSPDTSTWEGSMILTREIMAECRKHNPNWAMSFECNWDRMLQFGGATWWVGNQLITRKIFPENAETLGLYQAYDYLGVNNAVRNGHAVMVAPMNFCRGLDWPPFAGLARYIKEVKRIRDTLQDAVFYGEVLGQAGVKLTGEMAAGVEYNVFRNRDTGRGVCILTNSGREAQKQTIASFEDNSSGRVRIHTPFGKTYIVKLPAAVEIPGERIVFVEEIGGER